MNLDLMACFKKQFTYNKRWDVCNKSLWQKRKWKHWVPLFIDTNTAAYFDSCGIEYIPLEVQSKIKEKSITSNISRIQDDESSMCRCYYITFVEYMCAGKSLLDYTNLFSLNDFKKKDKIVYKYFKNKYAQSWI